MTYGKATVAYFVWVFLTDLIVSLILVLVVVALIFVVFSLFWGIGLKDTRSIIQSEETSQFLTAKEKLAKINEGITELLVRTGRTNLFK